MRPELIGLALIATAAIAGTRDPFQPPLVIRCEVGKLSPLKWKLLGMTANDGESVGWFLSPQGILTGMKPGDALTGNWVVASVTAHGVTLQGIFPCESQQMLLPLQGVKREKDDTRTDVNQQRGHGRTTHHAGV